MSSLNRVKGRTDREIPFWRLAFLGRFLLSTLLSLFWWVGPFGPFGWFLCTQICVMSGCLFGVYVAEGSADEDKNKNFVQKGRFQGVK